MVLWELFDARCCFHLYIWWLVSKLLYCESMVGLVTNKRLRWMFWDRTNSPAVSHIQNVDVVVNDEYYYGTWSGFIVGLVYRRCCQFEKIFLCLKCTFSYRFRNIRGKFWLQDNVVMQGIFEVFCTFTTTMAIEDTKDLQFRPWILWYPWIFLRRLYYVKNDWDAVFVGFANYSNVSVSCKCFDCSKSLCADLTLLKERQGALRLILL